MSDVKIPDAKVRLQIGAAQLRPVPLKFAPPVGGFGEPEREIYSHPSNLDYAAARAQAIRSPHE